VVAVAALAGVAGAADDGAPLPLVVTPLVVASSVVASVVGRCAAATARTCGEAAAAAAVEGAVER
jgi:hypothetical protein